MTVYAYVGKEPCGCIRAATVDRVETAKYMRRDVDSFLKHGMTLERMPIEVVRKKFCLANHKKGCPHPDLGRGCQSRKRPESRQGRDAKTTGKAPESD